MIKKKKKKVLPFNRCQINKTVEYSANRPTRTSIMFNVRENCPVKSAKLMQTLTDEYYKTTAKAKKKAKIKSETESKE